MMGDTMDDTSGPPYLPEPGQGPNILVRQVQYSSDVLDFIKNAMLECSN
jgi:hypothetical protein